MYEGTMLKAGDTMKEVLIFIQIYNLTKKKPSHTKLQTLTGTIKEKYEARTVGDSSLYKLLVSLFTLPNKLVCMAGFLTRF